MKFTQNRLSSPFNFALILVIITMLNACSKDPIAIDFEKYEGNWKPVSFKDWSGMHNAPPIIAQPGKTFSINGDQLKMREVKMFTDTNGNLYTTTQTDSFKLGYNVKTKLIQQGGSILSVVEDYYGYTETGITAVHLQYKREVDLSNMSVTPYSNNKFEISEDVIKVWYYDWGGYNATIRDRKLIRIR